MICQLKCLILFHFLDYKVLTIMIIITKVNIASFIKRFHMFLFLHRVGDWFNVITVHTFLMQVYPKYESRRYRPFFVLLSSFFRGESYVL